MKTIFKVALLSIFLNTVLTSYGQRTNNAHEIKIDALSALVVPAMEISYEYALNDYSSLGLSTFFRFDSPADKLYEKAAFTPYYRQYFFNNMQTRSKGLYMEAFFQHTTHAKNEQVTDDLENVTNTLKNTYKDLGIGFGGGAKFIANNGFNFDVGVGVGRNFRISSDSPLFNEGPDFFFRWGIQIGYKIF